MLSSVLFSVCQSQFHYFFLAGLVQARSFWSLFNTRRSDASAVLGVVILSLSVRLSVCPSVTRVLCDKTKQRILIPHERAITLVF